MSYLLTNLLTEEERTVLSRALEILPYSIFQDLLLRINYPEKINPALEKDDFLRKKVIDVFLDWVPAPQGCGLGVLLTVFKSVLSSFKEEFPAYDNIWVIVDRLNKAITIRIHEEIGSLAEFLGDKKNCIFMSYRRSDSRMFTERLHDCLVRAFGSESVFKDVDSIRSGQHFDQVLKKVLNSCEVALVIIGNQWLTVTAKDGKRRLDNPNDWVRIEVESVLNRDIPVIPVLAERAKIPDSSQLPKSLQPLVKNQDCKINCDPSFISDVARLIADIIDHLGTKGLVDSEDRNYGMRGFYKAIKDADPEQLKELAELLNSPSSQPKHIWHHVAHLRSPHLGWKQTVTDIADRIGLDWNRLLRGRQWDDILTPEIEKAVTQHLFGRISEMPSHHVSTEIIDSLPLKWRQLALAVVGVSLVR